MTGRRGNPHIGDIDRAIGRNLRRWRLLRGMTIADAAENAGCSPSFWQKVEAGDERMTAGQLLRFAHAVGITPAEAFIEPLPLSEDARRLLKLCGRMPVHRLVAFGDFVAALPETVEMREAAE
ncbi:MAG TPA: helix-turn-helix transcriptional regulator [Stellaceae bacterium]|nr:helix-turn-helix transcriptional regulator [Stellaceae bacterium]